MFNKETIIAKYDDTVYESREGGASYRGVVTSVSDVFGTKYLNTTVSGLDVPELVYDSVRYHVQAARSYRRQALRDLFDDLGDKMDNPVGTKQHTRASNRLALNFGRAFPLGADEGTDKSLGFWAVDDVKNAVASREENLKKQRASLNLFNSAADRAIRAIKEGVSWS